MFVTTLKPISLQLFAFWVKKDRVPKKNDLVKAEKSTQPPVVPVGGFLFDP